jgi:glycosyltransferase involved in cell wall biosynthesis
MRILIAHNYYQQPGGEDGIFEAESALLKSRGHTVFPFVVHNDQINGMNKLKVAATTIWNRDMHRQIRDTIRSNAIDVAHFHNTFPLISPAAYRAARSAGAAVVQTLHNHRITCSNAVLCRDGRSCQECVGRSFAWPGIVHGCYRGSRSASTVVALMQFAHRAIGTWRRDVDLYIAPSQSTRKTMCAAGLPPERVVVKPHFVDPDPSPGDGRGGYALFVGRLSPEKGIETLLRAWSTLSDAPPLKIVGDGPLSSLLQNLPANVEWLGRQPTADVNRLMGDAAALVFPSQCQETFGRVIAEAYAKGTPVIASNAGSAPEMIKPGVTGLLFEAGNAEDLARQISTSFSDVDRLRTMRSAARHEYESRYHADSNYHQLVAIYEQSLAARHGHAQTNLRDDELGRRQPAGHESV